MINYDELSYAKYREWVATFNGKCECGHELTVTDTMYYEANDDLTAKVDTLCMNCHYSGQEVKKYADIIK